MIKALLSLGGVFLVFSASYTLYNIILGEYSGGGLVIGISLFIASIISWVLGTILHIASYLLTLGRRDIIVGGALMASGTLHYWLIIQLALSDIRVIFLWAPIIIGIFISGTIYLYFGIYKVLKVTGLPIWVEI